MDHLDCHSILLVSWLLCTRSDPFRLLILPIPWALTQHCTLRVGIKCSKAKIRAVSIDIDFSVANLFSSQVKKKNFFFLFWMQSNWGSGGIPGFSGLDISEPSWPHEKGEERLLGQHSGHRGLTSLSYKAPAGNKQGQTQETPYVWATSTHLPSLQAAQGDLPECGSTSFSFRRWDNADLGRWVPQPPCNGPHYSHLVHRKLGFKDGQRTTQSHPAKGGPHDNEDRVTVKNNRS